MTRRHVGLHAPDADHHDPHLACSCDPDPTPGPVIVAVLAVIGILGLSVILLTAATDAGTLPTILAAIGVAIAWAAAADALHQIHQERRR